MIRTPDHPPSEAEGLPGGLSRAAGLLLIDVGNTRVAAAIWQDGQRGPAEHVAADDAAALAEGLAKLWVDLPQAGGRAVVVSSVAPAHLATVRRVCGEQGIAPVLVVGEDLDWPLGVDLEEPVQVGTDRLCTAAAAFARVKQACVVADFGTALTIDLVADNNIFLGGTIMPGMALAARALHEHTAQLPLVEVGAPGEILGKNTVGAIRNGIFAMLCGALREVAERYAVQIGKWPLLVVTGGDGPAVAAACDFVDHVLPDLCLDGLVIAYQNAFPADDDP